MSEVSCTPSEIECCVLDCLWSSTNIDQRRCITCADMGITIVQRCRCAVPPRLPSSFKGGP